MNNELGIDLYKLPVGTRLEVQTRNSSYVLEKTGPDGEIVIQGGTYFTKPTTANFIGSTMGGSAIKVGWIGHRLHMEICWNRHDNNDHSRLLTSGVRSVKIFGPTWEYEMEWNNS